MKVLFPQTPKPTPPFSHRSRPLQLVLLLSSDLQLFFLLPQQLCGLLGWRKQPRWKLVVLFSLDSIEDVIQDVVSAGPAQLS